MMCYGKHPWPIAQSGNVAQFYAYSGNMKLGNCVEFNT